MSQSRHVVGDVICLATADTFFCIDFLEKIVCANPPLAQKKIAKRRSSAT